MKRRIIAVISILVLLAGIMLTACSKVEDKKILVAYFSATGNTKAVAVQLATETGADLFEIVPKEPYTEVQLGYDDPDQRITKEQADEKCRVEIAGTVEHFEQYDTIYIGYPIWYGKVPRIILTFLESYDFEGREIIPFCTSDNDGIETGLDEIENLAPNADWQSGQRFDGGKVTKALDEKGVITDGTVKKEIADFAEKTSPNSETNKKNRKENADTTKLYGSEEAPFEEDSRTTVDDEKSTTTTNKSEHTTSTTEEQPTTPSTEPTTVTTTLGEHDTPYIPIS
jgi:flavodoxin